MIVWSGRGFISALILIIALIFCIWVLPESYSDYGFVLAFFISAAFSWHYGNLWNNQAERIFTDDKTGQKLRYKPNHSLFWIPMQHWGVIFSFIGIVILFQNSIILASVASIMLLSLVLVQQLRNRQPKQVDANQKPKIKFKSKKTILLEQKEEEERIRKAKEEELERLKRRKEKEDPSRFMPK